MQTRNELWQMLKEHVSGDVLLKHSQAVEIAMRAYAAKFGEDVEYWGAVGLLHDIDFERFPEEHPCHAPEILGTYGFDKDFITHVLSHARDWPEERTLLEKTLLAVDEMTGFVIACTLVRPDKDLKQLEVKSVMKKMKDKAFAKAVNRDTIRSSAAEMGVELEDHIAFVTQALASAVDQPEYREVPLIG